MNSTDYMFDLDAIMEFVFETDTERTTDTEITETFIQDEETKEMDLSSKILREVKGSDNTAKQTIRYDIIKMFIDNILNTDASLPSFGENVIINTMLQKQMLTKINVEE